MYLKNCPLIGWNTVFYMANIGKEKPSCLSCLKNCSQVGSGSKYIPQPNTCSNMNQKYSIFIQELSKILLFNLIAKNLVVCEVSVCIATVSAVIRLINISRLDIGNQSVTNSYHR
jgi:hypothetical protein